MSALPLDLSPLQLSHGELRVRVAATAPSLAGESIHDAFRYFADTTDVEVEANGFHPDGPCDAFQAPNMRREHLLRLVTPRSVLPSDLAAYLGAADWWHSTCVDTSTWGEDEDPRAVLMHSTMVFEAGAQAAVAAAVAGGSVWSLAVTADTEEESRAATKHLSAFTAIESLAVLPKTSNARVPPVDRSFRFSAHHGDTLRRFAYCYSSGVEEVMASAHHVKAGLVSLSLEGSDAHGAALKSLWPCPALTVVCLDGCWAFDGDAAAELCAGAPNVTDVDISGPSMLDDVAVALLTRLRLKNFRAVGCGSMDECVLTSAISKCETLQSLVVAFTRLDGEQFDAVARLPRLRSVYLSRTQLRPAQVASLRAATQLTFFSCAADMLDEEAVSQLPLSIEQFCASGDVNPWLHCVRRFVNLQSLSLHTFTSGLDASLLEFCADLPKLESANINGNSVDAATVIRIFSKCKALRKLYVSGCRVDTVRRGLPHVDVTGDSDEEDEETSSSDESA